jgi:phage protein D
LSADLSVVQSLGRQPRGLVKINGNIIPGWKEWEVSTNYFREADTANITLHLGWLTSPYDESWFAQQTKMSFEVFAGFPSEPNNYGPSDLQSLILGNVDKVDYNPAQRTLELSGRDLTSLLIDAKTTEKFLNQTASQVATTLAQRHGLTPVVTATQGPIGRYLEIDHTTTTVAQTEWDLLCGIAQQMQYVVYVRGNSLYFQPAPDPAKATPYPVTWTPATQQTPYSSNTKGLSFARTLTVGSAITVTVRSWHQGQAKGFSATYPTSKAKGIKPGTATEPAQNYLYVIGNLTQQQAQQRAQAIYNEIIKNEMRMNYELPGDNDLDITNVMPVSGTGTSFDQSYFPDSITRRMSFDGGYTMEGTARNHSPGVQPAQ